MKNINAFQTPSEKYYPQSKSSSYQFVITLHQLSDGSLKYLINKLTYINKILQFDQFYKINRIL